MTSLFEHNPWAGHETSRQPVTVYQGKIFVPFIFLGAIVVIAAETWLADALSAGPIAAQMTLQILAAVVLVAAFLLVAFCLPTYRVFNAVAEHVGAGAVILEQAPPFLGQGTAVARTFTFHSQQQPQICFALVDGKEVDADLTSHVVTAQPHDYFRRLRVRPETGRSVPEQPSEPGIEALTAIWDLRLELRHEDVSISEVQAALSRSVEADIDELVRLRLVKKLRRGIGSRGATYVALLPAGSITLASELRERGIEIYNNAKKEIPVTTIHNSGVIMNGSPGAVANVGSGQAIGLIAPEITSILTRLSEAIETLRVTVPDPGTQVALDEALDELGHELSHPQPSERRLKKFAQSAVELGGSGIAGFLGNAAWGMLAAWLGIAGTS